MKYLLALFLIAACAHSSKATSAYSAAESITTAATGTESSAATTTDTTNKVVEAGPVTITTVTRDTYPATPKSRAHVHMVRRVEVRAPVRTEQSEAVQDNRVKQAADAITATQNAKTTASTAQTSSTRVGPGLWGWLGIAMGGLLAVLLAWKFRQVIFPWLRIGG